MAEGLQIIRKAWSEETLSFDGKFFQIPEVIVNPKPVQKPLPPFYMATSSLDGVEVGARLGNQYILADSYPRTGSSLRVRRRLLGRVEEARP